MPNFCPSPAPYSPSSLPTLRLGSVGETVLTVRGALNLWPCSNRPPLATDANFAPKTGNKVREFQCCSQLVPDAVVGPVTWAQLAPLVEQIVPMPGDDAGVGTRIVGAAEAARSARGWLETDVPSPVIPPIPAALCAGEVNGVRVRQGGIALQQIMMIAEMAGGAPGRGPTIAKKAQAWWQVQTKGGTARRNGNDLPACCGISGNTLYSIDGNSFGPNANDKKQRREKRHRTQQLLVRAAEKRRRPRALSGGNAIVIPAGRGASPCKQHPRRNISAAESR